MTGSEESSEFPKRTVIVSSPRPGPNPLPLPHDVLSQFCIYSWGPLAERLLLLPRRWEVGRRQYRGDHPLGFLLGLRGLQGSGGAGSQASSAVASIPA